MGYYVEEGEREGVQGGYGQHTPSQRPTKSASTFFFFLLGVDVFYSRTTRAITIVDASVAGLRLNLARPLIENN